jgi:hypothetical protein
MTDTLASDQISAIKQIVTRALHQDHSAVQELSALFKSHGIALDDALIYALQHAAALKAQFTITPPLPDPIATAPQAQITNAPSGLPRFLVKGRALHAYAADDTAGQLFTFSTALDEQSLAIIADHLKDAVVAAILSKTTLKLKLLDTKDTQGMVLSCEISAEFARPDIKPISIFKGSKGEAGVNINILRKVLTYAAPSVMA